MDQPSHQSSVIEDDGRSLSSVKTATAGSRILSAGIVTLIIVVILAIFLLRVDPAVGVFNDDGWYLVLAKSLATGQGYKAINLLRPEHHFYPPFFPVLLSLLYRIWPDSPQNMVFLKSLSIVAVFVLGVVVFKLFEGPDRLPRRLAFLLAVCTVLAPSFVMLATSTLMSECLFACLQFGAVLLAERCVGGQSKDRRHGTALMVALLAASAYLTRMVGISLLIALGLHFLRRKMHKECALLVVTAVLVVSSWSIYSHFYANATPRAPGYASQFWQQRAGLPGPRVGVRYLPTRIWQQANVIVFEDMGALLAPTLYRSGSESGEELMNMADVVPWQNRGNSVPLCTMGLNRQVQLISLGFSVVVFVGFIESVRRDIALMDMVFCFSLLIIVLWPWDPIRFLVPLFPIILYYLILGFALFSRFLLVVFKNRTEANVWKASRIVILSILILFVFDHVNYLMAKRAGPASPEYPEWLANFNAEQQAAFWIRDHTAASEVIGGDNLPQIYFYAGRKTDPCNSDCAGKGIRYRAQFGSIQSDDGKVVFESRGKRVLELSSVSR